MNETQTQTRTRTRTRMTDRHNQVRALLRRDEVATLADISYEIGISEVYALRLVSDLIKKRQVEFAYTVPQSRYGNPRKAYRLTEAYQNRLRQMRESYHARAGQKQVEPEQPKREINFAPIPAKAPERSPWYRRILSLFSGNESRASV